LEQLKSSLMEKARLKQDSLAASRIFMSHTQRPGEKVSDFAVELKKHFKEAYPEEQLTSAILVQRFLTGLLPKVREQLLLRGKPDTLQRAVEDAINIEYALNFEKPLEDVQEVHAIHRKTQPQETQTSTKLQDSLDEIVRRLEALEKVKQSSPRPQRYSTAQPQRRDRFGREANLRCWMCGELGHLKRQCPLNYNGPVEPVGGWPRQ